LKNGSAKLRALLQTLPRYYNWQTAFQIAFQEKFSRALDVEKWWALQVVDFVSRDHGPRWTLAASREKLDQILSVPVEMRLSSNALPVHAEISLQTVIRNFDSDRQAAILQTKLRDLELAGFQMASPLAVLTDDYRRALEKYLGENQSTTRTYVVNKHPQPNLAQINTRDTIKKLNQLDARRRTLEATVKPDKSAQPSLTPIKF
ncbi:MAG TPA: hypothetical protein VFC85_03275, partial [Verrucomicrobiae bacterium]|nr:hypothetical protein [Verrucomicrobiae bacterium]